MISAAQHRLQRTAAFPLETEALFQKWCDNGVSLVRAAAAAAPEGVLREAKPLGDLESSKATMSQLPQSKRPIELSEKLRELGRVWSRSEYRPRVPHTTKAHWDVLLDEWAASDLPLVIRKGGVIRGSVVKHTSGRLIVIADNSPAQWCFNRAFGGQLYSVEDIRTLLEKDSIPFTFAAKTAEKCFMTYRCTLSSGDSVNKRGWKLCHIEDVGLNTKMVIETLSLESLVKHFKLLMAPSNHFLIPLDWGGLGEVPEFIEEIAAVEKKDGWKVIK